MREDWSYIINNFLHKVTPLLVCLALLLLSCFPLSISIVCNARPMIAFICVYFWLVYRPDLFNLASVFMFGLVADLMSTAPLGSNIFAFLVMYVIVSSLIRFLNGKAFVVLWIGFAIVLLPVIFSKWVVMSFYYEQVLPLGLLIFSYLLTVAIYPIIGGVNAFIFNNFLQEDI